MCAVLNETVVLLSDLRYVVMTCAKCKTEITFDLLWDRQADIHRTTATPTKCPACDAMFDLLAQNAVDNLREIYQGAAKQKTVTVSFRIKSE